MSSSRLCEGRECWIPRTWSPHPKCSCRARDPSETLELRLAGPVNGYNWTIDGKLYDPPNNGLGVTSGQRVRIRYINESKMFHPMHLHGVTSQVLRRNGPAARKDTVLVPPLATVEIDFDTDNPGRWITHCHNTYHLESGMAIVRIYFALAQQRARHHHALNLVGALVDLGDLGVAHHPLDREVLRVAGAAEQLHRVGGDLHRDIGGEALRRRRR